MKRDLAKDNPYMKMVVNILRTGNIIHKKVSGVLKKFEITHSQFNILRILETVYPANMSVAQITDGLLFSTTDVTRMLDRLEKHELITRTICPQNRRKMDVCLTEKGNLIIAESLPEIENVLEGYYRDRVSPEERDMLIDVLKRINA